jgi:hypothetical protein
LLDFRTGEDQRDKIGCILSSSFGLFALKVLDKFLPSETEEAIGEETGHKYYNHGPEIEGVGHLTEELAPV